MGRRNRQRERAGRAGGSPATGPEMTAPNTGYTDADGGVLVLRGALSLKSRGRYTETLHGGADREDAWQRATELLFELLAVSWTVAGVPADTPKQLIARYRAASADERRFVRDALRTHLSENFPELDAP